MRKTIVKVNHVGMQFNIYREKIDSMKEFFIKKIKNEIHVEKFTALEDVTFDIYKGDVFGIMGLNGSGKSTLLKVISGVIKPTSGNVETFGKIAPMIELGAGFDYDLTARENVFLNGSTLGYSKKFLNEKMVEIIEFSELENFMDIPIKNFSSGMVSRLGFAIATITQPDILIVDEVLSVGDFLFQQKCEKRINEMMEKGTTIIIVSHSTEQVERLCNRAVWLNKGHIIKLGNAEDVCKAYQNQNTGESS